MKRVLCVVGTRPEAIKLAPLVRQMKSRPDLFEVRVCATGQHRQMLDQVLRTFSIRPDHDLNLMKPNQTLHSLTADALCGLQGVLEADRPDVVLAQGDTTTVLAAALAAYYAHIKMGHIEAGLRTSDKYRPFPEEGNRRLCSALADYHFAPTPEARDNLLRENIRDRDIHVTGNTVIDALLWATELLEGKSAPDFPDLRDLQLRERMVLVTGHRRESFGEGFEHICRALAELARRNPDVDIVYPVHLNPNVRRPVYGILGDIRNVKLIEPLGYLPFVFLMKRSHIILTDSGGIQEEAPSLGKPVLVLRDCTERPEAVKAGTVRLVGTDAEAILTHAQRLLDSEESYEAMSRVQNPYGDGRACQRIAAILSDERVQPFAPVGN